MKKLAQAFRAMGDPTRLRILRLLAETPLNVSELVAIVGVAQPSVSHHLAKLKSLALIQEERQGYFSYYSLAVKRGDARWPLVELARTGGDDSAGDRSRLNDLLRRREDHHPFNERLVEPGQSWFLWSRAIEALLPALEVADFGCGSGHLSVAMARWAKRVTAVDKSESALQRARKRAAREGLKNIRFVRDDLERLSLASESIDLVLVSQSLHHVEHPERVLSEAHRVLRPRGQVVVLELLPHRETWVKARLGHQWLGFVPNALKRWLKSAGFARIDLDVPPNGAVTSPFQAFMLAGARP